MGVGSQFVMTPNVSKSKYSIGVGSQLALEQERSKMSIGVGSKMAFTPVPSKR